MARENIIGVRLTDEEYINLKLKAEASHKSVSQYIRELIILSKVKPVRNKNYYKVLYELNKIGNNINQIAKSLNKIAKSGECIKNEEYERLLIELYEINENMKKILKECK